MGAISWHIDLKVVICFANVKLQTYQKFRGVFGYHSLDCLIDILNDYRHERQSWSRVASELRSLLNIDDLGFLTRFCRFFIEVSHRVFIPMKILINEQNSRDYLKGTLCHKQTLFPCLTLSPVVVNTLNCFSSPYRTSTTNTFWGVT